MYVLDLIQLGNMILDLGFLLVISVNEFTLTKGRLETVRLHITNLEETCMARECMPWYQIKTLMCTATTSSVYRCFISEKMGEMRMRIRQIGQSG
jgi:hypothetical protein